MNLTFRVWPLRSLDLAVAAAGSVDARANALLDHAILRKDLLAVGDHAVHLLGGLCREKQRGLRHQLRRLAVLVADVADAFVKNRAGGGHDDGGREGRHRNVVVPDLQRETLRETLEGGLGGAVARYGGRVGDGGAYGALPGPVAAPDEMFTMAPCLRGVMSSSTAWLKTKDACTMIWKLRSQLSYGKSLTGRKTARAALLTSTSTGP